jgi:ABC-2 type transport system permease protein
MKRLFNEIFTIAHRILTELARMRRSLIFWAVFPTLMLLLFGLIYADDSNTARSFDATAPGILIGAALFFSCMGGPIALIVAERERHTLRRLLLSPLLPISYFLGIVLAFLVIAFGQTIIVYGIAYFFGGRFQGNVLLGLLILGLSVFSFVGLGFFFGARFTKRTEDVNGPVPYIDSPLLSSHTGLPGSDSSHEPGIKGCVGPGLGRYGHLDAPHIPDCFYPCFPGAGSAIL